MEVGKEKIKLSPRDFFLHLAAMGALYVSVVSILILLFEYIDVIFPDALEFRGDNFSGSIRFSIASLIIIFPLYIFLTRLINKDLRVNPEKRGLGVRKWLLYITLFIAGATLVGDLIAIINTFLGGELTTRFLLKAFSIFVIIGSVFGYYFYDLRGRWEGSAKLSKTVGWIASLLLVATIVGGFFIIGTPESQRLAKFDQEKIRNLETIQIQIVNYWQEKEILPKELSALEDPLIGFIVPTDPETDEVYGYRTTGSLSFELCATFNLDSKKYPIVKPVPLREFGLDSVNWEHEAGEHCFPRTIDPDRFPPLPVKR